MLDFRVVSLAYRDVDGEEGTGEEDVEEAEAEEGEEEGVVFVAYAVVNVITMMIKSFHKYDLNDLLVNHIQTSKKNMYIYSK